MVYRSGEDSAQMSYGRAACCKGMLEPAFQLRTLWSVLRTERGFREPRWAYTALPTVRAPYPFIGWLLNKGQDALVENCLICLCS